MTTLQSNRVFATPDYFTAKIRQAKIDREAPRIPPWGHPLDPVSSTYGNSPKVQQKQRLDYLPCAADVEGTRHHARLHINARNTP